MSYKCEDDIRARIDIFSRVIENTSFSIKEHMVRDYLIKYEVFIDGIFKGILQVFYSPNKKAFRLVSEKLPEDIFLQLKELFDKPLKEDKEEKVRKKDRKDKLYHRINAYYETLKPWRNKNFDFFCFSEELAKYFDDKTKKELIENSDNFDILEEYYLKLISKK
ncbi:MAG: hypothetical protein GX889_07495 [Clostridiales bacterium]|nr:hypothetical protein [Clostridiales bacterium]